ncbi:hypothetical protein M6B38_132695 [Iris pallida]|uniref:Uncharacterized protein n=1 Tax=Iris pallida TaxID=29817 RepID=A0AAX6EV31_IRIPA|nr:hypothetical protein M6B38_171900 [Iris pallida]KAJ6815745.1 hypothetical protein M6B38_132695 [Iris pallida]
MATLPLPDTTAHHTHHILAIIPTRRSHRFSPELVTRGRPWTKPYEVATPTRDKAQCLPGRQKRTILAVTKLGQR